MIRPPSRGLVTVSAAVLLVSVAMLLLGALRIGVTTDEPFHVQRYENYRATGWYLGDFQMDGGRPATGTTDQFVYGPATALLLQGIGPSGTDRRDYRLRHLGVALISLVGVAAVVATARLLLGSWRWGLVAGAILGSMPLWTGLAMFNVKDTPVASGCAVVTLGLTALARARPGGRLLRAAAPTVTAVGLALAIGTRPGIWPGVVLGIAVAVVLISAGPRWPAWRITELLAALVLGATALVAAHPKVFADPAWPYHAVASSSQFGRVRAKRSFVPLHVLTDQPLLICALALFGAALVAVGLRRGSSIGPVGIGGAVVITQAAAYPVLSLLHHTALENDLRQLLHVAPAVAVLATVGAARLAGRWRFATSGAVAVALLGPTVGQALLFPYNYVWTNPLDAGRPASLRDQRDYMAATFATAADAVTGPGRVICNKQTDRTGLYRTPPMRLDDEDCPVLRPTLGSRDSDEDLLSPVFWHVGMRFRQPRSCREENRVTRVLNGQAVVLSTLARCTRTFLRLGTATTRISGANLAATTVFAQGWTIPVARGPNPWGRPGARASGSSAALVFEIDPALRGRPLTLVLETDGRRGDLVTGRVGSDPTAIRWEGSRLLVPLTAEPGPVIVRLTGRLDLAVTAMRLKVM